MSVVWRIVFQIDPCQQRMTGRMEWSFEIHWFYFGYGVMFQLVSNLTGFLIKQLQLCCTSVSRFVTDSQTNNITADFQVTVTSTTNPVVKCFIFASSLFKYYLAYFDSIFWVRSSFLDMTDFVTIVQTVMLRCHAIRLEAVY